MDFEFGAQICKGLSAFLGIGLHAPEWGFKVNPSGKSSMARSLQSEALHARLSSVTVTARTREGLDGRPLSHMKKLEVPPSGPTVCTAPWLRGCAALRTFAASSQLLLARNRTRKAHP